MLNRKQHIHVRLHISGLDISARPLTQAEKTRTQKFSRWQMTAYHCKMKKKLDTDDEGMILDYESEPEMSEEYVLKYLASELRSSTETL